MSKDKKIMIILAILGIIFGLLGGGWSQRPIIDYKMDGLSENVDFDHGFLRVSLNYRNRGSVDSSLALVLTVTDANITLDQIEPWIEYNETQVKFHTAATARMENYASHDVKVFPVGNPQNFTLTYSIEETSGWSSVTAIINRLFLESHSYYPIQATYNKTGTNIYQWLKTNQQV
jgi:hypothetical protein